VDNFLNYDERCVQLFKSANDYHAAGFSKRKIAKLLGVSRQTVIKYVGGDFEALCRKTFRSSMDAYHDYIVESLKSGTSRKDVYCNVVAMGFKGKQTCAYDYMNRLIMQYSIDVSIYKSNSAEAKQRKKQIQAYDYITRSMMLKVLWMNAEISLHHKEHIFNKYPQLYELNNCINEFRQIFTKNRMPLLYLFIEKYKHSDLKPLASYAKGLDKDIEAVENAVSSNLSNGFVEGTVNKLKTAKRSMYGRCHLKLLSAKLIYDANR